MRGDEFNIGDRVRVTVRDRFTRIAVGTEATIVRHDGCSPSLREYFLDVQPDDAKYGFFDTHIERIEDAPVIRQFTTGATRDKADGKIDYEGFLNPLVLETFGRYMLKNQHTAAGERASDNWQKGMPSEAYMKSLLRHVMDVWKLHRGYTATDPRTGEPISVEEACGAVMFNVQGYLLEHLRANA